MDDQCGALITIVDDSGPTTFQCHFQCDHVGEHEVLYKEPRSGGLKLDIQWRCHNVESNS